MLMVGRAFRFLIFLAGLVLGVGGTLFAVGNQESIPVSLWSYSFPVPVYALALLPLGAGLLVGWAYTVPARAHEFADHWRSWKTLRRMERENKELRRSLDHVLEMPDDQPAVAAAQPAQLPAPAQSETPAKPEAADKPTEPAKPKLSELKTVAKPEPHKAVRKRAPRPAATRNGHAGKAGAPTDLPSS